MNLLSPRRPSIRLAPGIELQRQESGDVIMEVERSPSKIKGKFIEDESFILFSPCPRVETCGGKEKFMEDFSSLSPFFFFF